MHPSLAEDPSKLLRGESMYGFDVLVLHNGYGFRCGYLRVPEGHLWYGADYNDIDVSVHGGLTYCAHDTENGYWVGFDCAHSGDAPDLFLPNSIGPNFGGMVRSTGYVLSECIWLARAAAQVSLIHQGEQAQHATSVPELFPRKEADDSSGV